MAAVAADSLSTPIAHPVNLLVMGPAGYRPRDFARVGLPLAVICSGVLWLVLPISWPL
jgi:di/tricarboxylate transporter